MLRAFGHRVAMCCDMLGVVRSSLKMVIATRWPNARNMLRPTMLRYVALACCDRLAGALRRLERVLGARTRNLHTPYLRCTRQLNQY